MEWQLAGATQRRRSPFTRSRRKVCYSAGPETREAAGCSRAKRNQPEGRRSRACIALYFFHAASYLRVDRSPWHDLSSRGYFVDGPRVLHGVDGLKRKRMGLAEPATRRQ